MFSDFDLLRINIGMMGGGGGKGQVGTTCIHKGASGG